MGLSQVKGRVVPDPVRSRNDTPHRRLCPLACGDGRGQEREHATGVWGSDCKHHYFTKIPEIEFFFLTEQKQLYTSSLFTRVFNRKKQFSLETNSTSSLGNFT